jgi:hypothetical protein
MEPDFYKTLAIFAAGLVAVASLSPVCFDSIRVSTQLVILLAGG